MEILFTPWRYPVVSLKEPEPTCFFCAAAQEPEAPGSLVVTTTDHHLVMLNRYPYTNGHLMVAPRAHLADPAEAAPEAAAELWPLVMRARRLLGRVYSPDGINLGMNLGRAAGAGVPDHYHFHLVPRWSGDTSFASVIGGVRLVPEDLLTTRDRLRRALAGEGEEG
ncbi:MAG: HIT domain-containing protein [Thermoanaerobaculia bacterium]|nr:HIT domain-containing protein [Thermoanaerobaculia bacterium]